MFGGSWQELHTFFPTQLKTQTTGVDRKRKMPAEEAKRNVKRKGQTAKHLRPLDFSPSGCLVLIVCWSLFFLKSAGSFQTNSAAEAFCRKKSRCLLPVAGEDDLRTHQRRAGEPDSLKRTALPGGDSSFFLGEIRIVQRIFPENKMIKSKDLDGFGVIYHIHFYLFEKWLDFIFCCHPFVTAGIAFAWALIPSSTIPSSWSWLPGCVGLLSASSHQKGHRKVVDFPHIIVRWFSLQWWNFISDCCARS